MAPKPFSGGDKLKKFLSGMLERVGKEPTVQIGFLEGATYPDGTSVPMVAAIQEFGAPAKGIPPRPFFRKMIAKESPHWPADMAVILKQQQFDGPRTLDLMGNMIKAELQESIIELTDPPLKKATILARAAGKKRGAVKSGTIAKPLIDTGHMLNSVDYEVKK